MEHSRATSTQRLHTTTSFRLLQLHNHHSSIMSGIEHTATDIVKDGITKAECVQLYLIEGKDLRQLATGSPSRTSRRPQSLAN